MPFPSKRSTYVHIAKAPRLALSRSFLRKRNHLIHFVEELSLCVIRVFSLRSLAPYRLSGVNKPELRVRQRMQTTGGSSAGFSLFPGLPRKRAWVPGDVPALASKH